MEQGRREVARGSEQSTQPLERTWIVGASSFWRGLGTVATAVRNSPGCSAGESLVVPPFLPLLYTSPVSRFSKVWLTAFLLTVQTLSMPTSQSLYSGVSPP